MELRDLVECNIHRVNGEGRSRAVGARFRAGELGDGQDLHETEPRAFRPMATEPQAFRISNAEIELAASGKQGQDQSRKALHEGGP